MAGLNPTVICESLEPLRDMLGADGYELSIAVDSDQDTVLLEVKAGQDACEDCLVPGTTLELVARRSIADAISDADDLTIQVRMPGRQAT